jgi:hypothetical protein
MEEICDSVDNDCDSIVNNNLPVPLNECQALIDLYQSTNGDNWTDNTGWFTDSDMSNRYSITVSG